MNLEQYKIWALVFGSITFLATWVYAFTVWGFLIGLAIGWLPALVAGIIIGFLWPLAVLAIGGIILFFIWMAVQ